MSQNQAIVSINNEINYDVIDNNRNILLLSLFLLLFTMILIKLKPHTQKTCGAFSLPRVFLPGFFRFPLAS